MRDTMIKGIVFDLDGVYFKDAKKKFVERIACDFGVDVSLIEEFYLKSEEMQQYKQGFMDGDEFWQRAIGKWHITATKQELLDILKAVYERDESVRELLLHIKSLGLNTIVCSNNFPERIKLLNEKFDFLKDFDHIVLSYEHHLLKPALFQKLSSITGLSNQEIIIIDDKESSLKEAQQQGFRTILCTEPEQLRNSLREMGVRC